MGENGVDWWQSVGFIDLGAHGREPLSFAIVVPPPWLPVPAETPPAVCPLTEAAAVVAEHDLYAPFATFTGTASPSCSLRVSFMVTRQNFKFC
jgi:hypothetical protein